jgi:glycerol-3-phosphate acyltransferase PlsX
MADVTIALDVLGGDRAPEEPIAGAILAAREGVRLLLCGPRQVIEDRLGGPIDGVEVVDAPDVISGDEEPAAAVRGKPSSSIVTACRLVREGRAQGAVSAGSTGAMMAASLLLMGRIPGILRPGIAVALPAQSAPCLLIDCGANVDPRPEHLLQYGLMGSAFARDLLGVSEPRVGLLSIGEESSKGTRLIQEAHALLTASDLFFAGNCEGRDVLTGDFQVVVADGFAGNVLLKGLEGAGAALFRELRVAARSSRRAKLGAALLIPALREMRDRTDPEMYGGAYLLGVRGLAVIAHGNSSHRAIRNALVYAARGAEGRVVDRLSSLVTPGSRTGTTVDDLQDGAQTRSVPQVAATEIGESDDES